jgi:uncharacterized protein (TIGR03083 family)
LDYQAALIAENRLFTETVLAAESDTHIPTCPEWTMRQLMRHVGRAHRWAARLISVRGDVSLDPRTVPDGRPPDDVEGARAWLLACPQVLIRAVADVGGPDTVVATFDGPRPAGWWIRRLLHETTAHRADAVLAVGQHYDVDPDVAADGIDEWLGRLAGRPRQGDLPVEHGMTVTLRATDVDATWTLSAGGDNLQLDRRETGSPEGVQVSGPAADLYLALLRRRDVTDTACRVGGDLAVWETFLARTPYAAPGTD